MRLWVFVLSDFHAPGGLTGGLGVVAGGYAVNIGAAVLAAVALLSRPRQTRNAEWFPAREGLLGLAASVLALGFLIIAIGAMVYASSASSAGAGGSR